MDGQTIFAILFGAALACFSLVMVGYSFFRPKPTRPKPTRGDAPGPDAAILSSAAMPPSPGGDGVGLDAIYDSVDTLELDYQLGNLPESQYREQLQAYRLQAAAAVKSELERGLATPELLLEQEVLTARTAITPPSGFARAWQSCPQCDAPIPPGETPCPHCGAALRGETGRSSASGPSAQ